MSPNFTNLRELEPKMIIDTTTQGRIVMIYYLDSLVGGLLSSYIASQIG